MIIGLATMDLFNTGAWNACESSMKFWQFVSEKSKPS
jgi:hypothetical protein